MNPNGFHYYITSAERSNIGSEPMVPLPAPGEGGPAYPGNDAAEPVIPLPPVGDGGPVYPGDDIVDEPVVPLPPVGEGGPVYPGDGGWPYPGSSSQSGNARVRFLNAAYSYPAFRVSIGGSRFVNRLNYAAVTGYGRVRSGYHTVTVTGTNGRIYIQKVMPFQRSSLTTIAIIRTAGGLDLLQIPDQCCPPGNGFSSFRIGNLAYNSGPLDVVMSDGRVVYGDLRYKEVAAFKRITPGTYQFFYADTNLAPMPAYQDIEGMDSAWLGVYPPVETFGSLILNVTGGEIYTIYLIQNGTGRNNIQNLILADR